MDADFKLVQFQPNTEEFELNFLDENSKYILEHCNTEGVK